MKEFVMIETVVIYKAPDGELFETYEALKKYLDILYNIEKVQKREFVKNT